MSVVNFPDPRDGNTLDEKVKALNDAYFMMKKRLTFLLQNLDAENVVEAQSVVAEWVYAGTIVADQINGGTITGITINGVYITGSSIYGGNITVQQSININPSTDGGINLGGEGLASIYYEPSYHSIAIQAYGGVNIGGFLSYNSNEVATQAWVTANFVHK